jgi:hypothetical protein
VKLQKEDTVTAKSAHEKEEVVDEAEDIRNAQAYFQMKVEQERELASADCQLEEEVNNNIINVKLLTTPNYWCLCFVSVSVFQVSDVFLIPTLPNVLALLCVLCCM